MEHWSKIVGYDYEISSLGRLRNMKTGTVRRPAVNDKGYFYVVLMKNYKQRNLFIHILVAKAFVPNPNGKPMVNHLDLNKQNNAHHNLEWATNQENCVHYWANKP
ncbi:NUMOD4 motif protein [compost metagenome]